MNTSATLPSIANSRRALALGFTIVLVTTGLVPLVSASTEQTFNGDVVLNGAFADARAMGAPQKIYCDAYNPTPLAGPGGECEHQNEFFAFDWTTPVGNAAQIQHPTTGGVIVPHATPTNDIFIQQHFNGSEAPDRMMSFYHVAITAATATASPSTVRVELRVDLNGDGTAESYDTLVHLTPALTTIDIPASHLLNGAAQPLPAGTPIKARSIRLWNEGPGDVLLTRVSVFATNGVQGRNIEVVPTGDDIMTQVGNVARISPGPDGNYSFLVGMAADDGAFLPTLDAWVCLYSDQQALADRGYPANTDRLCRSAYLPADSPAIHKTRVGDALRFDIDASAVTPDTRDLPTFVLHATVKVDGSYDIETPGTSSEYKSGYFSLARLAATHARAGVSLEYPIASPIVLDANGDGVPDINAPDATAAANTTLDYAHQLAVIQNPVNDPGFQLGPLTPYWHGGTITQGALALAPGDKATQTLTTIADPAAVAPPLGGLGLATPASSASDPTLLTFRANAPASVTMTFVETATAKTFGGVTVATSAGLSRVDTTDFLALQDGFVLYTDGSSSGLTPAEILPQASPGDITFAATTSAVRIDDVVLTADYGTAALNSASIRDAVATLRGASPVPLPADAYARDGYSLVVLPIDFVPSQQPAADVDVPTLLKEPGTWHFAVFLVEHGPSGARILSATSPTQARLALANGSDLAGDLVPLSARGLIPSSQTPFAAQFASAGLSGTGVLFRTSTVDLANASLLAQWPAPAAAGGLYERADARGFFNPQKIAAMSTPLADALDATAAPLAASAIAAVPCPGATDLTVRFGNADCDRNSNLEELMCNLQGGSPRLLQPNPLDARSTCGDVDGDGLLDQYDPFPNTPGKLAVSVTSQDSDAWWTGNHTLAWHVDNSYSTDGTTTSDLPLDISTSVLFQGPDDQGFEGNELACNNGEFFSTDLSIDGSCTFDVGSVPNLTDGKGYHVSVVARVLQDGAPAPAFKGAAPRDVDVDITPPVTTIALNGTAAPNTPWYSSPVTVTLAATDGASGSPTISYVLDNGAATTYDGPFTIGTSARHHLTYHATDLAGNVETDHATDVLTSLADPTTTCSVSAPDGQDGWSVTAPSVTLAGQGSAGPATVTFALDGGAWTAYDGAIAITTEGVHTIKAYATDEAGRTGAAAPISCTVKYDHTPPTTNARMSGTIGDDAWWRSAVDVALSASDLASTTTYASLDGAAYAAIANGHVNVGTDGTHTLRYYSVDDAGNAETAQSLTLKVDQTRPSTGATLTGTLGTNGWYRSATVNVTLTANDDTSGARSLNWTLDTNYQPYNGNISVTGEGTHTLHYYATDNAGNVEATRALEIDIDSVAPTTNVTFDGQAPDGASWYNHTVKVGVTASDASSGVATIDALVGSGSFTPYSAPFDVSVQGLTAIQTYAVDTAGNAGSIRTDNVKIDSTPPVVTATASCSTPGDGGWCRGGATVTTSASDPLSGLDGAPTCALDGASVDCGTVQVAQDGQRSVRVTARDVARNVATTTASVSLDATPPVVSIAGSCALTGANGWCRGAETLSTSATDATSGIASTTCALDGASVACGSVLVAADGAHTLQLTATDAAGNSATTSLTVHVDATLPTVTTAPACAVPGNAGWCRGNVSVTTSASDGTSGIASFACDVDAVATPCDSILVTGDGTHHVNATATDNASNARTSTLTLTIDATPPTLTGAADITQEATSGSGASVSFAAPAASDATSGTTAVTCAPASGKTYPLAATTVTCTTTDVAGNSASASFVVTVVDTTPPVIAAHTNVVAEATSASGATVSYVAPATTDAVDGPGTAACSPTSSSGFALGSTLVTCVATDAHGNHAANTTFVVNVTDTTPPAISVPADFAVEAASSAGANVTFNATAQDIVDGVVNASCSPASGATFALGATTVTCNATDAHGNAASATFHVTVQDTTSPIISTHANVTAEATSGAGAIVNYTSPATSDAVDGAKVATCSPASGDLFALGAATVTCNATDTHHNVANATTFTVFVVDTTPPTIDAASNLTQEATSGLGATVTYTAPATHDLVDGQKVATCAPTSGSTFAVGNTTVTCSATDAHGNAAINVTFVVSVVDTTPPTITNDVPATLEATGPGGAVVSYHAAANDIVDGAVAVTCSPANGTMLPLGATTIACNATDAHGNVANATFHVLVQDTTPPALTPAANVTANATSAHNTTVTYVVPNATDVVDGAVNVTCAPASGSMFDLGSTTVKCSATDAHGNAANETFVVSVVDVNAPTIDSMLNLTLEATSPRGAVGTYTSPATHDAVDGNGTATCSPASNTTFALGNTTVTCTAVDSSGNHATNVTFNVDVRDTTAPALSAVSNLTVEATGAYGAYLNYSAPTWTDAVDVNGTASCSPPSGGLLALGSHLVTCSVTDAHGNANATSFSIAVVDRTAPVIQAHANVTVEATGPTGALVNYTAPDAVDAVNGTFAASCSPSSGLQQPIGVTLVTCNASDASGNNATPTTFSLLVVDTTPPTVATVADQTLEATGPGGAVATFASPGATDIVDGSLATTCSPKSNTTFALGNTTVTCSATDAHNNTGTTAFHVLVKDTTPPVIDAHLDVPAEATSGSGAIVSFTAPLARDVVTGNFSATCSNLTGDLFPLGTTIVTCNAVDGASNHAAATQFNVTVTDSTAPVIDAHASLTKEAANASGVVVDYAAPATHDAVDGTRVATCAPASGGVFALGATTVTCSATDAHGNVAINTTFVVTVVDTTPPTVTAPSPIVNEAASANGTLVTWTTSASDLVDGTDAVTCSPASGTIFAITTTSVACNATDAHGNVGWGNFTVTVRDTTAPAIDAVADITTEATGHGGATVTFAAPLSHDAVDGNVTTTCVPASGSVFTIQATTVTCSVTDAHQNANSTRFTITVRDTTPPTIAPSSNLTIEATSASGAIATYASPATTDVVDGSGTAVCEPASGGVFALGSTTVTCSATDAHGNAATNTTFVVSVLDTTAPSVRVPAGIRAEAAGPAGTVETFVASATDAVDGTDAVSCAPASGSTFAIGNTTVTCRATDAHGNTGSASFVVEIVDTTPPVVTLGTSCALPGNAGWCRTGVALTTSATDSASGVQTTVCTLDGAAANCTSRTIATAGDHSFTENATDASGNVGSASVTFRVDQVAPAATASVAGTTGTNGWYTTPVRVTLNASDATSGAVTITYAINGASPTDVAGAGTTLDVSTEGPTTITYHATDAAGNVGADQQLSVKIDSVAPATTATVTNATQGSAGWYRSSSADVVLSAADATSGGATTYYSLDGSSEFPYSGPVHVTNDAVHTLVYHSVDAAGNVEQNGTLLVRLDSVIPQTSATVAGTLGQNGWFVSPASVTLSATDGLSGAARTLYRVVGVTDFAAYSGAIALPSDGTSTIEYYSIDAAGNQEPVRSQSVQVDRTPPAATVTVTTGTPGDAGWYRSPVTVNVTAVDATSGLASLRASTDGGATYSTYSTPVTVASEGSSSFCALATDLAGNSAPAACIPIAIDSQAPTTTASVSGTLQNGWYRGGATLTLAASDASPGSGVAQGSTLVAVNGGSEAAYAVPLALSSTGTYVVSYHSTDVAGNVEPTRSTTVRVDAAPPVTTATLGGTLAPSGWYTTAVTVTLSASDIGSGVATTQSSLDGADWSTYAGALTVSTDGAHTLAFRSVDAAGLVEDARSVAFKIESAKPTMTITPSGTVTTSTPVIQAKFGAVASGWDVASATLTLNGNACKRTTASVDPADGSLELRCQAVTWREALPNNVYTVAASARTIAGTSWSASQTLKVNSNDTDQDGYANSDENAQTLTGLNSNLTNPYSTPLDPQAWNLRLKPNDPNGTLLSSLASEAAAQKGLKLEFAAYLYASDPDASFAPNRTADVGSLSKLAIRNQSVTTTTIVQPRTEDLANVTMDASYTNVTVASVQVASIPGRAVVDYEPGAADAVTLRVLAQGHLVATARVDSSGGANATIYAPDGSVLAQYPVGDADGDGVPDPVEGLLGSDPNNASSTPIPNNDGQDNYGVILRVDGTPLAVATPIGASAPILQQPTSANATGHYEVRVHIDDYLAGPPRVALAGHHFAFAAVRLDQLVALAKPDTPGGGLHPIVNTTRLTPAAWDPMAHAEYSVSCTFGVDCESKGVTLDAAGSEAIVAIPLSAVSLGPFALWAHVGMPQRLAGVDSASGWYSAAKSLAHDNPVDGNYALVERTEYSLTPVVMGPNTSGNTSDPDGDGITTTAELLGGSDPWDPSSVPSGDDNHNGCANNKELIPTWIANIPGAPCKP